MKVNATMAFNEGYISGYNQARVDSGAMLQAEADKILGRLRSSPEKEMEKEPEWVPRMNAAICEMQRKRVLYKILKYPLKEMVNAYVKSGGQIEIPRSADCIGMVWERSSEEEAEEDVPPPRVEILTDVEKLAAIRGYNINLSFQDIATSILAARNAGLVREMTREIGRVCSKVFKRQMYPIEFYGKVEE